MKEQEAVVKLTSHAKYMQYKIQNFFKKMEPWGIPKKVHFSSSSPKALAKVSPQKQRTFRERFRWGELWRRIWKKVIMLFELWVLSIWIHMPRNKHLQWLLENNRMQGDVGKQVHVLLCISFPAFFLPVTVTSNHSGFCLAWRSTETEVSAWTFFNQVLASFQVFPPSWTSERGRGRDCQSSNMMALLYC